MRHVFPALSGVHREKISAIACVLLSIGLFVQLGGFLFNNDGSQQATQVHLLLFIPALVLFINEQLSLALWKQPCALIFLALVIWVLLRGALATDAEHPAGYWAKICLFIVLYVFSVTYLLHSRRLYMPLLAAAFLAAGFAWMTIYYQFMVLGKPLDYETVRYTGRLFELGWQGFADFSHPIPAGLYYGFFGIMLLGLLVEYQARTSYLVLTLLGLAGILIYVLLTFSRGAWFSALAAYLTLLILSPRPRAKLLLIVGFTSLVGMLALFWPEVHNEWRLGTSQRGLIWLGWLQRLPEFWLLGNGAGTDMVFRYPWGDTVFHAHSLYLQLWYEYGVLAIVLFIAMLLSLFQKAWKLRERLEARVALAMLVLGMVAMVSDVHAIFHRPSVYWIILWLPVGLIIGLRKSECSSN
ncbi:O-antigen ligase domain-containing protein [Pseudomonas sp. HMWF032]|nr:O-antigen ligase domain-containing protein [Pseudomonas sp. HMWF032]PTT84306.1 O-antigen ligase domain-containing protein [Pseudomonas sp. HMWF010]